MELFLAACGSAEPLRLALSHRDQVATETFVAKQPFLVIGRSPDSDLVLDHWQVSRRHAYLQLIDGRFYCVDLGSRTGTHGGDVTERSGWLERGRSVRIGPYMVQPTWPTREAGPLETPPAVTLELPGRESGPSVWRMDRHLVLIGRSPSCKIRIVEPDVSKFHASLLLTTQGLWVVDLLGQKGVFVNDEMVRCVRLDDGDELRIGRHVLRTRYDDAARDAASHRHQVVNPTVSRVTPATVLPISTPLAPKPGNDLAIPPPAALFPAPAVGPDFSSMLAKAGGAIDPSVNLLVHQFGMMQQNMLDQFHQTMMMMFEGFATLHREQAGTIREEFENVRKLSEEIEALRAETARLAQAASRPPDRFRPPGFGAMPPLPPRNQLPGEPSRKVTPPPADPEVDIHAQLCHRLASIESERQNRWQKILGMMTNKG